MAGPGLLYYVVYERPDCTEWQADPAEHDGCVRRLSIQAGPRGPGAGAASFATPTTSRSPDDAGRRRRGVSAVRRSGTGADRRLLYADRRRSLDLRRDRGGELAERYLRHGSPPGAGA